MEKINSVYEKLKLKRDICKFVFDMRCFCHMMVRDSSNVKTGEYQEYMIRFANWDGKLSSILTRAKELGINPNILGRYGDDLLEDYKDIMGDEENPRYLEIKALDQEINYLMFCCKKCKSLSEELIKMYEFSKNIKTPFSEEVLTNTILSLVDNYGSYSTSGSLSYENYFFSESCISEEWFIDCYVSYFFQDGISLEEHNKNFKDLVDKMIRGNGWAVKMISRLAPRYAELGVTIDFKLFSGIIECLRARELAFLSAIHAICFFGICPYSAMDYIDVLFDEEITGKSNLEHGERSVLYRSRPNFNLGNSLAKMILPLANVAKMPFIDFCKILACKVALLEEHLEVAIAVSDYLKTLTPDYSAFFEREYLREVDSLPQVRNELVMVMKQISDRNGNKQF